MTRFSKLLILYILAVIYQLNLSSFDHFAFAADTEEQENESGRVFLADFEARDRLDSVEDLSLHVPQPNPMKNDVFVSTQKPDLNSTALFSTLDCGRNKGCLFKPEGCTPHTNCSYAFSYKSDGQRVFMELLGQINAGKNAFVAVAFSFDTIMGNDTVTSCSSFQDEPFSGRLSYNPGKTNRKVPVEDSVHDQMLTTHLAQISDGTIYCQLSQKIVPLNNVVNYYVRPLNQSYRIFLSSGLTENRQLTVHSLDLNSDRFPFISKSFVLLTAFEQQNASFPAIGRTESSETTEKDGPPTSTTDKPKVSSEESAALTRLLKAHAILMILAWTVLVPTAILSARYLRDHWIDKVMGVHVWFLIHRSVNYLAVVMVTASFVCIFARQDWMWMGPMFDSTLAQNTSWPSLHCMTGLLACCLAWFQPLSALLRCHPDSFYRLFFNIIHTLSGLIGWTLAMVTLYIGITTFRAFSNPLLAKHLFISYLAILLCSFLVLEFVRLQKNWRKKQQAKSITPEQQHKLPIYNNNFVQGDTRNAFTAEPSNQKKLNAVQKGVLLSFVACAIATAAFICLLILF